MGSELSSRPSFRRKTTYQTSGKDEGLKSTEISSKSTRHRKKKQKKETNRRTLDSEHLEEAPDIYEDVESIEDRSDYGVPDYVVSNQDGSGETEGADGYLNMLTAGEGLHSLEAYGVDSDGYVPATGIVEVQEDKPHAYTALQWPRGQQPSSTDLADSVAERNAEPVAQAHHTTAVPDLRSHDQNVHGPFSSTQLHTAVEAQDDSGYFNLADAYAYQNQSLGAEMINNSLKRGDDDGNRILSPAEYLHKLGGDSSQSTSSRQMQGLRDTLPRCTAEELSSLSTELSSAPTAIYYRTSVERSLCKVQLAANYLVVVPFDSGTVGEFCGMMSEDYDGTCSILDTDQCPFNKRIPLNSLTAPFIIQFGAINNFVNNVVR